MLPTQDEELFLLQTDQCGTILRAMIAYSDFEKDAVRLDGNTIAFISGISGETKQTF